MLGWDALYTWILNYKFILISVILLAFLIWNILISFRLRGLFKIVKTNRSTSPMLETWHVSDRISEVDDQLKDINNNLKQLREAQEQLKSRSVNALQKVGLVRFDAFPNAGGQMSFSLALLDDRGMGVVVTSLFGREECRLFAKPVIENSSTHALSEEEKAAIAKAKKP